MHWWCWYLSFCAPEHWCHWGRLPHLDPRCSCAIEAVVTALLALCHKWDRVLLLLVCMNLYSGGYFITLCILYSCYLVAVLSLLCVLRHVPTSRCWPQRSVLVFSSHGWIDSLLLPSGRYFSYSGLVIVCLFVWFLVGFLLSFLFGQLLVIFALTVLIIIWLLLLFMLSMCQRVLFVLRSCCAFLWFRHKDYFVFSVYLSFFLDRCPGPWQLFLPQCWVLLHSWIFFSFDLQCNGWFLLQAFYLILLPDAVESLSPASFPLWFFSLPVYVCCVHLCDWYFKALRVF